MVCATEKYNLREASCCNVEVVNGAAGLFLAGFFSRLATEKLASKQFLRKASASALVSNFLGNSAWKDLPSTSKRAVMRKADLALCASISRSRSTIKRTATDCTRPAESPVLIFFQRIGESSNPTNRSKMRRACWAFTRS